MLVTLALCARVVVAVLGLTPAWLRVHRASVATGIAAWGLSIAYDASRTRSVATRVPPRGAKRSATAAREPSGANTAVTTGA